MSQKIPYKDLVPMNIYRKFTQQKYPALPNFHTFVDHWEILLYAYLVIAIHALKPITINTLMVLFCSLVR